MMRAALFLPVLLMSYIAHAATISGTVSDQNGAPLASMTVDAYTLAGTRQASGATTSGGTFSLNVPAGTYRLLAYDPTGNFATSFHADAESFETAAPIALTSNQNATGIQFRLVRAGFVVGRVISTDGAALQNMTVAAYNPSGTRRGFTKSDANGNFTLALPPGTFTIAAYDEALHYATAFALPMTVTIASTQSAIVSVSLPLAATLTGRVTDRATAAPLAMMHVAAYGADGALAGDTRTDSDGRYAFAVRPDALRVVVDDPEGNYATTYVPDAASFATAPAFAATAGQTLTLDATLVRGGRIAGRVTNRRDASPLAGIDVVAYNADGTTRAFARTDASGLYSIVVPPGDFRIGAFDHALSFLPQFYSNASQFSGASVVHANGGQTSGGFDFSLVRGARVTGQVTARTTAMPLAGMTVAAYDPAGRAIASVITDAAGAYTLFLAPAAVKLLAFDPALHYATAYYLDAGTFDATRTLSLFEGQAVDSDFALPDAGRITGTVVDAASSAPLAGIRIFVYDAAFATIAEVVTDGAGTFRVAAPAGTYTIAAADDARRYDTGAYDGPVSLAAGQNVNLSPLRLSAAAATSSRRRAVRH